MYFKFRNLVKLSTGRAHDIVIRNFSKRDSVNAHHLGNLSLVDFESELMNIQEIENNYSDRRREPDINLHALKDLFTVLRNHASMNSAVKKTLRSQGVEGEELERKKKVFDVDKMTAPELKRYYVRQKFEEFDRNFQNLRSYILHFCLLLPNKLNVDTPRNNDDVILRPRVTKEVEGCDHVEVGRKLDVLFYENCASYFLLNEAAIFEVALQRYLSDVLSAELKFKPFQNPDICNDFLCFGSAGELTENEGFLIEGSVYRLTGGASLASFCAYRTNETAHTKYLPERFFTCGRRYTPPADVPDEGLYSVAQQTNVHLIIMCASMSEMKLEFENTIRWLITLYELLDLDFRVCYKRASALHLSESLRASVQLYSPQKQDFIEVAHLSMYDDFISRRLRMVCHDKANNSGLMWLIDGVVVSVPVILAHLLERSKDKLLIPECVRSYMYTTASPSAYK